MSCVWKQYKNQGLSDSAVSVIMNSWRDKTRKQYITYIKKWEKFCRENKIQIAYPNVCDVVNFLETLFAKGLTYSVLNTARSAISSFVILRNTDHSVGNHPTISRFMRGVFNMRPALPRYVNTWDVSVVISYLKSQSPTEKLSFKQLTMKLVMLMALLSGQRAQSIQLLDISKMSRTADTVTFVVDQIVKQTRPGYHLQPISFKRYAQDTDLCVVRTLDVYLEQSSVHRGDLCKLFISFQKPYNAVTSETISRWLKSVLASAGIDTNQYKGHSVRSAATSAAFGAGTSIQTIMNAAGWSSECTFNRFYNKQSQTKSFSDGVLHVADNNTKC